MIPLVGIQTVNKHHTLLYKTFLLLKHLNDLKYDMMIQNTVTDLNQMF